jgi:hypothetical protein
MSTSLFVFCCAAVEQRLTVLTEIRESIELVHTGEYAGFLSNFLDPFLRLLQTVPPSFMDNTEHKLRNTVLDILNRWGSCSSFAGYIACWLINLSGT